MQPSGSTRWIERGRTETSQNNRDPDFKTKIVIPFGFWEQKFIKFEIYNSEVSNSGETNSLGFAICNLSQILYAGRGKVSIVRSFLSLDE